MTDDGAETPPASTTLTLACPECNESLEVTPGETAAITPCPACGKEILIPAADGSTELPVDEDDSEARRIALRDRTQEQELNGLRMRQLVATKRSAIRTRTYCIVGAVGCAIGAAKLVEMTVGYVRVAGWQAQPVGYVLFVLAFLAAGLWCLRRAAYWNAESRINPFAGKCEKCGYDLRASTDRCPECGTPITDPHANPDFSTLQDGSQFARDLDKVK